MGPSSRKVGATEPPKSGGVSGGKAKPDPRRGLESVTPSDRLRELHQTGGGPHSPPMSRRRAQEGKPHRWVRRARASDPARSSRAGPRGPALVAEGRPFMLLGGATCRGSFSRASRQSARGSIRPATPATPALRAGHGGRRRRGARASDHEADRASVRGDGATLHPCRFPVSGERGRVLGAVSVPATQKTIVLPALEVNVG